MSQTWSPASYQQNAAFVPALKLPPSGLLRALWSTGQIVTGMLMILVAQIWLLILMAPDDDKLGNKDVILSGRLWALAARRLPGTRAQFWLASWGKRNGFDVVTWARIGPSRSWTSRRTLSELAVWAARTRPLNVQ